MQATDVGPNMAYTPKFSTHLLIGLLLLAFSFPINAQTTILPFGDSITRGTANFQFNGLDYPLSAYRLGNGTPSSLRSYREHLHDLLIDAGCNANFEWVGTQTLL